MKNLKITILFVLYAALTSSCSTYINTLKEYNAQEGNTYPGTVLLKNGVQLAGEVAFPNLLSKTVLFINQKGERSDLQAAEIEKIELHHASAPGKVYSIYYLLMKKNSNSWVVQMDESKYVTAYICAAGYKIKADGSLELGGYMRSYSTGPNGARAVEQPSFPVYLKKETAAFPKMVGVKGGAANEGSALRMGVSRYLKDDPQLTEYMRNAKWGVDDIDKIVENYIPNRTEDQPFELATIAPLAPEFISNDFTKETIFYLETAFPQGQKPMFGLGMKYVPIKFIQAGANIGYAPVKYVSSDKRIENHPFITDENKGPYTDPLIPEDYATANCFNANIFAGLQLPMDLKKLYLIPSASMNIGGLVGSDYYTLYYGPSGMIDIGIKLNYGDVLLIGGGYRYNIPIKKTEASYPGYDAFIPFGSALVRLTYKF
jgi:hypothetical protein